MKEIKRVILVLITVLSIFVNLSCSSKSESVSITSTLDEIDNNISLGQFSDALKSLEKLSKKAKTTQSALGIYKRYLRLGENKKAEKLILSAIKSHKDDKELKAVYSSFLLKENRVLEALGFSETLSGGKYASIYSEAVLKNALEKNVSNFQNKKYRLVYLDAYEGTKDNVWLRNVAVMDALQGSFQDAERLHPEILQDVEDAYFWALIKYDSSRYAEAVLDLNEAKRFLSYKLNVAKDEKVSAFEILSLLSDSYVNLGEDEKAQTERKTLFENIDEVNEKLSDNDSNNVLAILYLNSAAYSLVKGDLNAAYRYLTFEIKQWPDYVPALIAYANYAYNSSLWKIENPLTNDLRALGVSSLEMKKFDSLPRIPLEDALSKMEKSLSKQKSPLLYVAKLELEDKISNEKDSRVRAAKMWRVLEETNTGVNEYPSEIMRYAVHLLIQQNQVKDAERLFYDYITTRYKMDLTFPFWDTAVSLVKKMELWEVEYLAWFASFAHYANPALRLYEYAVYESASPSNETEEISPKASLTSVINLAMIYSSTRNTSKAIELYGRAAGRISNPIEKSEVMYRIAKLYSDRGNVDDALSNVKYCLSLNPSHAYGKLLYYKLTEK